MAAENYMNRDYKIIKQHHNWTSDEKIKWLGYGEWVEEADSTEFEYLGYHSIVIRILKRGPFAKEEAYYGGHLCGYVQIPETHPYFRQKDIDIECHGGITFNEAHEQHWIGFDCGYSGDLIPTSELFKKQRIASGELHPLPIPEEFKDLALFNPVYRNMEYCIGECIDMITQLIDVAVTTSIKKGAEAINEYDSEI